MALDVPKVAPTCVPLLSRMEWRRTYSPFVAVFVDPNWTMGPWVISVHLNGPKESDGPDFLSVPIASTEYQFTIDAIDPIVELGRYAWQVWAVHATEGSRVVESGQFDLVAGFLEGDGSRDITTHAGRMLALVEARLEGRIGLDAESYSIGGRSLSRISIVELQELRSKYKGEARSDRRVLEAGKRLGVRRRIRVGF